jgi:uncharacterized membrane protein
MTSDSSIFVLSLSSGVNNIFRWNGSSYTASTLPATQYASLGSSKAICISDDGKKIAYSSTYYGGGYTYISNWNGTTFTTGIQTLDTNATKGYNIIGYAFSNDNQILFASVCLLSISPINSSLFGSVSLILG